MNQFFGLTIESLVAVLLLLTILYCAKLNSRLKLLKADERAMKATITELMLATESAERAIAGLKLTVREAQDELATKLRDAEGFSVALAQNMKSGEDMLNRLRKIAYAGRLLSKNEKGAEAVSAPGDTSAIVAAAQAFAERARARTGGIAA